MNEDVKDFIDGAIIWGKEALPICGKVIRVYDAFKKAKAFVEERKNARLMKGLADFSQGQILDPEIKEKIEKMDPDEWESISLKVVEVLEESDDDDKPCLIRQLVLARLDKKIDAKTFNALAKAFRELPSSIFYNIRFSDEETMEKLVPYGIVNRKFEVYGHEVQLVYNKYRTIYPQLQMILQMAEEEKNNAAMRKDMEL
jgi:hypothetical protein